MALIDPYCRSRVYTIVKILIYLLYNTHFERRTWTWHRSDAFLFNWVVSGEKAKFHYHNGISSVGVSPFLRNYRSGQTSLSGLSWVSCGQTFKLFTCIRPHHSIILCWWNRIQRRFQIIIIVPTLSSMQLLRTFPFLSTFSCSYYCVIKYRFSFFNPIWNKDSG